MSSLRRSTSSPIDGNLVSSLVAERAGRNWCLFLDRDGVINTRVVDDYVRGTDQFEWRPLAQEAIEVLRDWAPNLVVVTNQQGVGKGLMTADTVAEIHQHLQSQLPSGCDIDAFLVCPHLESDVCSCRKPKPGLVLDWLDRHPETEASLSVIVGDSPSDMQLARNVAAEVDGCTGISVGNGSLPAGDASFDSLWDFAVAVQRARNERIQ